MSRSLNIIAAMLAVAAAPAPAEDLDYALRDAAARIEYGWLAGDESLMLAAERSLATAEGGSWRSYLRAYAAYRLAQHRIDRGRAAGSSIDDCYEQTEFAIREPEAETEAWVVQAACAALAIRAEPLRAVLHQRRMRQALTRARELDADNPRFGLVVWQYLDGAEAGSRPAAQGLLAAFRAESERNRFPNWGEPEAMSLLASLLIEAGDVRGARDLVQEALLLAPGYAPALALERRIQGGTHND